jgi:hypothetical protein
MASVLERGNIYFVYRPKEKHVPPRVSKTFTAQN